LPHRALGHVPIKKLLTTVTGAHHATKLLNCDMNYEMYTIEYTAARSSTAVLTNVSDSATTSQNNDD